MAQVATLNRAQLGAMIGAFQFSANMPLLVPGETAEDGSVVARPISQVLERFEETVMEPMLQMEKLPSRLQTPFGKAWMQRARPRVSIGVWRGNDDCVEIGCATVEKGHLTVSLSCQTKLFTVRQSAEATRTSCRAETEIEWALPRNIDLEHGRGQGSAAAWQGIADGQEYQQLGPDEIRRLVSQIDFHRRERTGEVQPSRWHPGSRFLTRAANVFWISHAWRGWETHPSVPYSPLVNDLLAAAAKMRPDLFPFRG